MNKNYIFLSALLIGLGVVMALLPEKKQKTEVSPKTILLELNDETRFVSTDQVAHSLIEADPQIQLIDVRTIKQYNKFSLPGAINIPIDSLLNPNFEIYLDQIGIKSILFSNGTVYANQAWMIYRRKAYENIYIMKGGLNRWVETIMQPEEPILSAPGYDFDLYQSRVAASQYFGGGSANIDSSTKKKKKTVIRRKNKKKAAKGGCS